MKHKRPLVNPRPEDFGTTIQPEVAEAKKKSKEQLSLGVDSFGSRVKQGMGSLMHSLRRRKDFIEVDILWKSPALPFAIVSGVFVVVLPLLLGIVKFNSISPNLPLFYNNIDKHWESTDKSEFLILILFIGVIEAIVVKFISLIYKSDKRLAKTLAWFLTFVNVLFYISFVQIYLLTT